MIFNEDVIQFFGSNIEWAGLFQKKTGGLRAKFFEPPLEYFIFFTLLLEIPEKTKLHPWKFHKIKLRLFSFWLKTPSRWKIPPRFSWVHAQIKHNCAILENRAEKLGGKKSWTFSTFVADFLSWNFNIQSGFVLISTTFFSMAFSNETTRLSWIFWLCYSEFSFSKTVLSAECESTEASSSATMLKLLSRGVLKG